jgi:hypothetical protein
MRFDSRNPRQPDALPRSLGISGAHNRRISRIAKSEDRANAMLTLGCVMLFQTIFSIVATKR